MFDVVEADVSVVKLPLSCIVDRLRVRHISVSGLARIRESMQWAGFLDNYPLIIAPLEDGTYQLIDGNHRYEAARSLGIETAPCVVKETLDEAERYMLAFQSNGAAECMVPSTLVTYAEFIWARLAEKDEQEKPRYTQADVARMLGWSRESVKNYAALQKICHEAWAIIGTAFEKNVPSAGESAVPSDGTVVPFTENLLRSLLDLTPAQQKELVEALATNKDFSKSKFKTLAESYDARNKIKRYALEQLGNLGEHYEKKLADEVDTGGYDADWEKIDHPKLHKLLASLRDEYEQKHHIRLIHGDFYEEVKSIPDSSIDLVLTDPPYNISSSNEYQLEGRTNISRDFGEWDAEHHTYLWAQEWARILRVNGSGYVFTQDSYISTLRKTLEEAGIHVRATLVWHKTNPGAHQGPKTNFTSSVEYLLFFTKGDGAQHTFNWQGENEMHNHIETSICSGNERVVDAKGKTLHPTQKPERLLKHFAEISSNRGDVIFDGFMGVGSTGKVAKALKRKFIGIEQDKTFFDAAVRRLADD